MLNSKLITFHHFVKTSRKLEDVDFGLATEDTQSYSVIIFSRYQRQKYFEEKVLERKLKNILQKIEAHPFGGVSLPFLYSICSPHPIIFLKIPLQMNPLKLFYSNKIRRWLTIFMLKIF